MDELHPAHGWELPVQRIVQLNRHQVVSTSGSFQRGFQIVARLQVFEVRQQKGDGALPHGGGEVSEGFDQVAALALWGAIQDFTHDAKGVGPALAWRDELLHPVGEEHGAHLVVVAHGAEGQNGGQFGHQVLLGALLRAALDGATHVHQQEHREFTFLLEHFDVRGPRSGGHVPIDGSDLVARLVLTVLAEGHAATLERALVFARENAVAQAAGGNLHLLHLFQQFRRLHGWGRIRGPRRGPSTRSGFGRT